MSNVVSMTQTCDYLVRRAAVRRRKGNYDEAMMLLSKAKDQFGLRDEIEIEMARVYDEMECEEDATRAYLRVVRLNGPHKAEALFQLTVSAMQRGDFSRALSYYELLLTSDQIGVSAEYMRLLGDQLRMESESSVSFSRRGRARMRIRHGVECMHAGRLTAARRAFERALRLRQNAQAHTLLACCALLQGDAQRSIEHGQRARRLAPSRVQALLVLADAYAMAGEEKKARDMLYLASMHAKDIDDLLATALESAKRGCDHLTIRLTKKLLRFEPFHTRAMMLQACALVNLRCMKQAQRLFARVCVLMPENTVSEALFRMTREGNLPAEQLTLGLEVPYEEGVARAAQLLAALYMTEEDLQSDADRARALYRIAHWAFRSQLAGGQVATVALLVMRMMNTPQSLSVLMDALTDPQVDDAFKTTVLQILTGDEGVKPYPVDIGGRLVHLAAGGSIERNCDNAMCRDIVQRAADALAPGFVDAPKVMLDLWIKYLSAYDAPKRKAASACTAALEYVYHILQGRQVSLPIIARRYGAKRRLCAYYVRRMLRMTEKSEV